MSPICSYVHYRKQQRSLQGSIGSCISHDGPCGAAVWKGRAGDHAGGDTQKNMTRHAPLALGAGVAPSAPTWPPALRTAAGLRQECLQGAAGRARHEGDKKFKHTLQGKRPRFSRGIRRCWSNAATPDGRVQGKRVRRRVVLRCSRGHAPEALGRNA